MEKPGSRFVLTMSKISQCKSTTCTAQKIKFSMKGFFSKCDQIRSFLKQSYFLQPFLFYSGAVWGNIEQKLYCLRIHLFQKSLIKLMLQIEYVNMGINFDNKPCHQKLKHDCNKDKVEDLIILLSITITNCSAFTCQQPF